MKLKKINTYLFFLFFLNIICSYSIAQNTNGFNGLPTQNNSSRKNISSIGGQLSSGNGTLGLSYSASKCGLDYKSVSVKLGQRFSPIGVAQPAALAVSGIPTGAIIEKAFLYAGGVGNGSAQTATLNSSSFPMTIIGSGPDICWGYTGTYGYFADVTSAVTGNGTYTLSGLLTTPPNGTSDMNGATLIVIYRELAANFIGHINISDGIRVENSNTQITTIQNINVPCTATNGRAFDVLIDIQATMSSNVLNSTSAPFTYDWWNYIDVATTYSMGQTSSSVINQSPGDCYALMLYGTYFRSNCSSFSAVSVSTVTMKSPDCFGSSNGSVSITGMNGTAPYTYTWSASGSTMASVTGLSAGVYSVMVQDVNQCVSIHTINITEPSAISSTVNATNVLCNGSSTGSASVTVSGGTLPYTYSWSAGPTASVATGLNAGIKTVTITDGNNCLASNSVTLTEPSPLSITMVSSGVLCKGGANGSATVTAGGGVSPYTYSWSAGGTSSIVTGLNAGVKTVTITDNNSCVTTRTVLVTEPTNSVSTTTLAANVSCNGGSNGSATVSASGGTGAFTYSWSSGATSSVVTGLNTGVRTVTVADANNCIATNTVFIGQPPALTLAVNSNSVLCKGGATGSATTTAGGGTGPFTYSWSSGGTSSVVTAINAGVHTASVTDANNCKSSSTFTITEPTTSVTAAQSQTNITCVVQGQAEVTASDGTPGYTYTWTPVGGNGATSSTLNAAGGYTVTIADANNCQITKTFVITADVASPTLNIAGTDTICDNEVAMFTVSGADTYSWNIGWTAPTLTVSPDTTTTYSVTGTSTANGCSGVFSHTLVVNPLPLVTLLSGSICVGQSFSLSPNGAATYTVSGGTFVVSPTVTTTYSATGTSSVGCVTTDTAFGIVEVSETPSVTVNSGSICSGNSFTINPSGASSYTISGGNSVISPSVTSSYSVIGSTTAGCQSTNTAISTVTVFVTPMLAISVSQDTICEGESINVSVTGAPSYTWSTGSNSSSFVVTPLNNTNYTVTGESAGGCSATASANVVVHNVTPVSINGTTAVCIGNSMTLQAVGANTYSWSTGDLSAGITKTPSLTTVYSVQGTDGNGCSSTASNTITVFSLPQVNVSASSNTVCSGSALKLTAEGAATYVWNNGVQNGVTFRPINSATYSVVGKNADGCADTASISISVLPSPTVTLTSKVEIGLGETYTLNPSVENAVSFTWTPETWLNDKLTLNPVVNPNQTITYTLTATSKDGCKASDDITLTVINKDIIIANFMSPNGDGKNDTWKINIPALIKDYSVEIVDSYGQTVFSKSNNYENEFDGKRGGQDLPDGVYYYFIKDGTGLKYKGSITLTK